jgi:hypothetical protein
VVSATQSAGLAVTVAALATASPPEFGAESRALQVAKVWTVLGEIVPAAVLPRATGGNE